jgi:prepilin-type processing-associated H-X9-DG protein
MTPMQKELYRGRTLSCNNCAKTFTADNLTPVVMAPSQPWAAAAAAAAVSAPVARAAPAPPPAAAGSAPPPPARRGWVIALLTVGGVVAVIALLLLVLIPPISRAREQANRVKCAANMRLIGQAMMIYASAHGGQFPDTADKMLAYVPSSAFVCPSCDHTPAPGSTPQLQAQNLYKPGHLSYVYVGGGYRSNQANINPATTVVLYEPLTNHKDGINVLHADGSVMFLARPAAQTLLMTLSRQKQAPVTATVPVAPSAPQTQPPGQVEPVPPSEPGGSGTGP